MRTVLVALLVLPAIALLAPSAAACSGWDSTTVEKDGKFGHYRYAVSTSDDGCVNYSGSSQPAGSECMMVYREIDAGFVRYVSSDSCSASWTVDPSGGGLVAWEG